ncbi:MAG: GMC oxidoreductase, partial [Agromyces sp.]
MTARAFDHDVVIVGSGFGGSVAALRLASKGYRVHVFEAGRRFADADFAKTSWDVRRYLWAPAIGCFGVQRIHKLPHVMILAGAGVGGGSLNYANTLYEPGPAFFADRQWQGIADWQAELAPHYATAKRMLGVVPEYPHSGPVEQIMADAAADLGVGETFRRAPVGVYFGRPGETVADPFFGGEGPDRTGCTLCGNCMVGCRVGAKNTLAKNYLALAERLGTTIEPLRTVVEVRERTGGGFIVTTVRSGAWFGRDRRSVTAEQVVFGAGTWGTQQLLHRMKDTGLLPRISGRLGALTRTNSEALVGSQTTDRRYRKQHGAEKVDFTKGVAITSSIHPNASTHIEPVRYGKRSNAMGGMTILQVPYSIKGGKARVAGWLGNVAKHPWLMVRSLSNRRWSERTIIGLVMQTLDNSLTTYRKEKGIGKGLLTARQGHGAPNPTQIPEATEAATLLAKEINGFAGSNVGELMGTPLTAHFLGGCPIGDSAESGVIDPYHRLYGHPGISVVDGAAVSANLGVN